MSLPLEQFLATYDLRIVAVAYLEPSRLPWVIRRVLVLGYEGLEIESAAIHACDPQGVRAAHPCQRNREDQKPQSAVHLA
jgi:hypothetical protein